MLTSSINSIVMWIFFCFCPFFYYYCHRPLCLSTYNILLILKSIYQIDIWSIHWFIINFIHSSIFFCILFPIHLFCVYVGVCVSVCVFCFCFCFEKFITFHHRQHQRSTNHDMKNQFNSSDHFSFFFSIDWLNQIVFSRASSIVI